MMFLLLACAAPTRDHFDVGGEISALMVDVEVGNVRIVGGERSDVSITRRMEGAATGRPLVEEGLLTVEASCESLLPCRTDLDIEVPADLPVMLSVRQGDGWVVALRGELTAELQDGDLDATELGSPILRARLGTGDAFLRFESVPSELRVAAGMGDLRVVLPPGGYDLDLGGLGGVEQSGVVDERGAPKVELQTSAGRVSLRAELPGVRRLEGVELAGR
jgi:hypothetical protein